MLLLVYQGFLFTGMGVVTFATVYLRTTQAKVLGSEVGILTVMTVKAEHRHLFCQQTIYIAVMRLMTAEAFSLLGRTVRGMLRHSFLQLRVAGKTEHIRLIQQQ